VSLADIALVAFAAGTTGALVLLGALRGARR